VGHITDIARDGYDAILFEREVSTALATSLARVLRDRSLRARLSENGRRTCIERFSIEGHCRQIEGIYRTVLDPVQICTSHCGGRPEPD
jgi:glycosyltransferase involved in cell wall biosynthesis